jgi:hypothetical protein
MNAPLPTIHESHIDRLFGRTRGGKSRTPTLPKSEL